jgi:hypothetical protein
MATAAPMLVPGLMLAPVVCARLSCCACGADHVGAQCSVCWRPLCWDCAEPHCAACGQLPPRQASDYGDSPRESSRPTPSLQGTDATPESEDVGFFESLAALWDGGHGAVADFSGHVHCLPILSRCYIWEAASWSWRFFATVQVFQKLSDDLQWEIPDGLIVFNIPDQALMNFRCGAVERIDPAVALELLQEKPTTTLGLLVRRNTVAHLEIASAGDLKVKGAQPFLLDKMLRTVLSTHEAAFWRE